MGLFSLRKNTETIAFIDIGSASVGGAYTHFADGTEPIIYYTARIPVEAREGESILQAMLRSLAEVERLLIEEGGPTLRRETGSGHVDKLLVSIGAPWQETHVTVKNIQQEREFVFTRALLDRIADEAAKPSEGFVESARSVVATVLNGYETADPFGKRAKRADMVILSSSLEKEAAQLIRHSLERAFHTHAIELTAFAPVAYAVFRDLYPHQKDFLILEVSGTATDAVFVKKGLLADVETIPHGSRDLMRTVREVAGAMSSRGGVDNPLHNQAFDQKIRGVEEQWLYGVRDMLAAFASRNPLPRTLFLLADDDVRDFFKHLLDTGALRTLRLSDEPLSILPLLPQHLAPFVKTRGVAQGDLFLALLSLFYGKRKSRPTPQKEPGIKA